jgi:DNA-binding beta-propeller fold protein YncE
MSHLWATSSGNDRVIELDTNGYQVAGSPFSGGGLRRPLGIAIDSLGNVWVANNGGDSLTALEPNGAPWPRSLFSGGGLDLPWGIAVDGADNIWVANFTGRRGRISAFCGARTSNCPLGLKTA